MLYVPRGIACTVESHKRRGGHTLYTYIYIYICDVCVCVCVCVPCATVPRPCMRGRAVRYIFCIPRCNMREAVFFPREFLTHCTYTRHEREISHGYTWRQERGARTHTRDTAHGEVKGSLLHSTTRLPLREVGVAVGHAGRGTRGGALSLTQYPQTRLAREAKSSLTLSCSELVINTDRGSRQSYMTRAHMAWGMAWEWMPVRPIQSIT